MLKVIFLFLVATYSTHSFATEHTLIHSLKENPIQVCNDLLERAKTGPNFKFPEQAPVVQWIREKLETVRTEFPLTEKEEKFRLNFLAELKEIEAQGYGAQSVLKASEKFAGMIDILDYQHRGGNKNGAIKYEQWNTKNLKRVMLDGLPHALEQDVLFKNGAFQTGYLKLMQKTHPEYLFIPTFEALDLEFFARTLPSRCQIVGLVPDYVVADGQQTTPLGFLHHDLFHTENIIEYMIKDGSTQLIEEQMKVAIFPYLETIRFKDPSLYHAVTYLFFQALHERFDPNRTLSVLLNGNERLKSLNDLKINLKTRAEGFDIDVESAAFQRLDDAVFWLSEVYPSRQKGIPPETYAVSYLNSHRDLIEFCKSIEPIWERIALDMDLLNWFFRDTPDLFSFCSLHRHSTEFQTAYRKAILLPIHPKEVPVEQLFSRDSSAHMRFVSKEAKWIFSQKLKPYLKQIMPQFNTAVLPLMPKHRSAGYHYELRAKMVNSVVSLLTYVEYYPEDLELMIQLYSKEAQVKIPFEN